MLPDLHPPLRYLFGSGPSNPDPRVLRALSLPLLGQFDPAFTAVMNEVMDLCRHVFQTRNRRAYPVSGTSRSGMEAVMTSLLEPGDATVVGVCGRFGDLFCDLAERAGAAVVRVEAEWGQIIPPEAVIAAIRKHRPKVVAMVHGETSTGVLQPLEEIGVACATQESLLVVDAVLTLGGLPVETDRWKIDACIGGTQKCLGCPSGLAPVTYGERAEALLRDRRTKIRSNYLDLTQLQEYWGPARYNHHTAPTSMVYAIREALRVIQEEGLEARFARHRQAGKVLRAGLQAMGLALFGDPAHALEILTPVMVPDGVSDEALRADLLARHGIEVSASFGRLRGRVFRIGMLGYNARTENVVRVLEALEDVLPRHGVTVPRGAGVEAALAAGHS